MAERDPAGLDDRPRAIAARLIHQLDHRISAPGPLLDVQVLTAWLEDQWQTAAVEHGGDPAGYRAAFIEVANQHGWELAGDGSNWAERWRAIQAAGRQRARWTEFRDALEDLD